VGAEGGAPLGPDTFRFFRSIGVNLKQVYGSTETTGWCRCSRRRGHRQTAGRPCPGIEVKIAERGEVLSGSRHLQGLSQERRATREARSRRLVPHGRRGLRGSARPSRHRDRAKDVGALQDGTPFRAAVLREQAKYSPFIREAVAFWPTSAPSVTAMIAIDQTRGELASGADPYTSYMDLSQKPEVWRSDP